MTPIPAEPPIGGAFWSIGVPLLLFTVALLATVLLYRRFSAEAGGRPGEGDGRP